MLRVAAAADATCRCSHQCAHEHEQPSLTDLLVSTHRFKTIMCRKGASCNRDICFFAHSAKELRMPTKARPMPPPDPSADAVAAYSQWVTGGTSQMPETPSLSLQVPASTSLAAPPGVSLGLPSGTSSASCDLGPLVSLSAPSLPGQQMPAVLPLVEGPLVTLPPAGPVLPGQQSVRPLVPPGLGGSSNSNSRNNSAQLASTCSSSSSNAGGVSNSSSSTLSWPAQIVQQGFTHFQSFPAAGDSSRMQLRLPAGLQQLAVVNQDGTAAAGALTAAANNASIAQMAVANGFTASTANQQQLLADLSVMAQQQQQVVSGSSPAQGQCIVLSAANHTATGSPSASSSSGRSFQGQSFAGGEHSNIEHMLSGLNIQPIVTVQQQDQQQQQQYVMQQGGVFSIVPMQTPCSWAAVNAAGGPIMLQPVMQQATGPVNTHKVTAHVQCVAPGLGQHRMCNRDW